MNFKHRDTLIYQYNALNRGWLRYPFPMAQEGNYYFALNMRIWQTSMEEETWSNYLEQSSAEKEKIYFSLSDLLSEVQRSIDLYKQRQNEFSHYDYEGQVSNYKVNWYKLIYEHSEILKKFIIQFKSPKPFIGTKPSRREVLKQAYKSKGSLTPQDARALAKEYFYDEDGMINFYYEIFDELKKAK